MKNNALSGHIDSQIKLDAKNKTVQFESTGKDLNMDKIRAFYLHVRDAHINTQISLNTKGNTFKELTNNMNGQIILTLLEGATVVDKWFNSLPIALNVAKQKTDFLDFSTANKKTQILCAVANIPIKDGVLLSDNSIAIQTEALNILLNGSVNLKKETLDLKIIPSISGENNVTDLPQLIHTFGPWNNLKWQLDKKNSIQNQNEQVEKYYLCKSALGKDLDLTHPNKKHKTNIVKKNLSPKEEKQDLKELLLKSLTPALSGIKKQ
jgi:uncharacterized protein involved in outer membrane biogenesis